MWPECTFSSLYVRGTVIHLVRENYSDFGPQLANEKLRERHELHVGVSTLRDHYQIKYRFVRSKYRS